ncbi:MAG: methyltransferase, partial [Thiobacillus sp.]|nr:methyltransferase [Thiobacillus sp.]
GVAPDRLARLLRALAVLGVCDELPGPAYALTEAGQALRGDSAAPLREQVIMAVEHYWPAWADLAGSLRDRRTAHERAYGMSPWQYRREHAELDATFNSWCAKESAGLAETVVDYIDCAGVATVADIGGGNGGLLAATLARQPHLTAVLFDQPHVVAQAAPAFAAELRAGRVALVGGDFFAAIPVRADLFLLKSVLHNWEDAEAGRILANCRAAMADNSRLLVVERLLPEHAGPAAAGPVMLDIHMMAILGGRERSLAEFAALLAAAGLAVAGVSQTRSGLAVIEARPI